MIAINNVSKSFGHVQAVKNVNVEFLPGKIYGLLGRNGAGKSTLLNLITNRLFVDAGEITVDGLPVLENDAALGKIYLMGDKNYYADSMKLKNALYWASKFYPNFDMENANFLAKEFGLDLNKKVKQLSTGMGSMFRLTVALSSGAPYVFLDEPVLGLDAVHRDLFYKLLIEQFSRQSSCYIISTHLIEEVAGVMEDVVIIKDGEILLQQPTEELLSAGCTLTGPATLVDEFTRGKEIIGQDSLGGMKSVYLMGQIERSALPQGIEVSSLNLQQLFVQLTKD